MAGGCLWGVQEFLKTLNGVVKTEAGRANGSAAELSDEYDGYAECVKTTFDPTVVSATQLAEYLFEIIDPYSIDRQGMDIGKKYRTGVYSENRSHLEEVKQYLSKRSDKEAITLEVLPLTNYVRSADEHQDRLSRCPVDYRLCHIPKEVMYAHRAK